MSAPSPQHSAGFTLIEMVIALALFALISMAGIALVDSVIRVEERTTGRLDRLGQAQRAMFLLTRDFEQLSAGSLAVVDGGVRFTRNAASLYEPGTVVAYTVRDDGLYRLIGADDSAPVSQLVLTGVSSAKWSFLSPGAGWRDVGGDGSAEDEQPVAVAVDLSIDQGESGLSGTLRRVVELPAPLARPPDLTAAVAEARTP